jgi:hypothetical protein
MSYIQEPSRPRPSGSQTPAPSAVEESLLSATSQQVAVTTTSTATEGNERRSGDEEEEDSFGLELLHEPAIRPANPVQIIFVHGLGGSKRGTWTHPQTRGFWPAWLKEHPGLDKVRIATFGYNSAVNPMGPNTNLSIPIFATQLLDDMTQLNDTHGPVRLVVQRH